jgi:RHS repeat-associated protein
MSHSNGSKVAGSDGRFLPFGAYRGAPPATNPSLTDIGFTGHKHNDYINLVYMNSRWYAPEIGRFLSADPIIPDPTNPQSYNRYTYVYNNPLGYVDEDGHVPIVPVLLVGAFALWASTASTPIAPPPAPNYLPPSNKFTGCTASLAACHQAGGLRPFENGERISQAEFNELLGVVALEMYTYHTPSFKWYDPITARANQRAGRDVYDTPFYNGGGRAGLNSREVHPGAYPSDQQVCLNQGCFGRSDINYFAQGMWAAAAGDSLKDALDAVKFWNWTSYGLKESEIQERLYWTEFGYNWYLEWLRNQEN